MFPSHVPSISARPAVPSTGRGPRGRIIRSIRRPGQAVPGARGGSPVSPSPRPRRPTLGWVVAVAVAMAGCRGGTDGSRPPTPEAPRPALPLATPARALPTAIPTPAAAAASAAPSLSPSTVPPTPTSTAIPTEAPAAPVLPSPPPATPDPGPAIAGAPAPPPAPAGAGSHVIPGVAHVWQKWNNCGPSSILMALSPFGIPLDQLAVAAAIKPDREDTNVSPDELAAFARAQGMRAIVRYNGNRGIARALVAAGVPVLAEQWVAVEGRGEMGHYRVAIGYDDAAGEIIANDSYYGANRRYGYDAFEQMWRPFVGAYVVAYRPEQEEAVRAAIGPDWDDAAMWQRALDDATRWAAAAPGDAWAWFALGEIKARMGDHGEAVAAFDRAIGIGLPFRAFWYQFGYYRALVETGAYDRAVAHADATLGSMKGENLEESHYWRGIALRRLGREDEARASFERALAFNPGFAPAREALAGGA